MRIILASQSPRRRQLLKEIFAEFTVMPTDAEENFTETAPDLNVMKAARDKARAINRQPGELVIGSDTTVYMDGKYYNKPVSKSDAVIMLGELSGRTHIVYTGVCLIWDGGERCFCDTAEVDFNILPGKLIEDYVATGSPMDKAGAYGIQDAGIVRAFRGDYSTIMGLPIVKLREELIKIGGYHAG